MELLSIRAGTPQDIPAIITLYQDVAATGSLGRQAAEVTLGYVTDFVTQSLAKGLLYLAYPENRPEIIAGEIHGYPLGLKTFAHVFEQVTMAVHPAFQGRGLGKKLLQHLQEEITRHQPTLMKVELKCFSNNERALQLYLNNGFVVEGRHRHRVNLFNGQFADGISLGWFNPGYRPPSPATDKQDLNLP